MTRVCVTSQCIIIQPNENDNSVIITDSDAFVEMQELIGSPPIKYVDSIDLKNMRIVHLSRIMGKKGRTWQFLNTEATA